MQLLFVGYHVFNSQAKIRQNPHTPNTLHTQTVFFYIRVICIIYINTFFCRVANLEPTASTANHRTRKALGGPKCERDIHPRGRIRSSRHQATFGREKDAHSYNSDAAAPPVYFLSKKPLSEGVVRPVFVSSRLVGFRRRRRYRSSFETAHASSNKQSSRSVCLSWSLVGG